MTIKEVLFVYFDKYVCNRFTALFCMSGDLFSSYSISYTGAPIKCDCFLVDNKGLFPSWSLVVTNGNFDSKVSSFREVDVNLADCNICIADIQSRKVAVLSGHSYNIYEHEPITFIGSEACIPSDALCASVLMEADYYNVITEYLYSVYDGLWISYKEEYIKMALYFILNFDKVSKELWLNTPSDMLVKIGDYLSVSENMKSILKTTSGFDVAVSILGNLFKSIAWESYIEGTVGCEQYPFILGTYFATPILLDGRAHIRAWIKLSRAVSKAYSSLNVAGDLNGNEVVVS